MVKHLGSEAFPPEFSNVPVQGIISTLSHRYDLLPSVAVMAFDEPSRRTVSASLSPG